MSGVFRNTYTANRISTIGYSKGGSYDIVGASSGFTFAAAFDFGAISECTNQWLEMTDIAI